MSSIVLELQKDLLDTNCDILKTLRKAHIIAVKLNLSEFDEWIQNELNGYESEDDNFPEYRKMNGELKANNPRRGWIPMVIVDKNSREFFRYVPILESISYLIGVEKKSKDGYFYFSYPTDVSMKLCMGANLPAYMECALHISTVKIIDLIDIVKNRLLEWTLELEKNGIWGENMTFSVVETESAKKVSQQINNYYGGIFVSGNVNKSQLITGNNTTAIYGNTSLENVIEEIKKSIEKENISDSDKADAIELLEDVSGKIKENRKPNIIKASVDVLKNFVASVGADVTASLIAEKIKDLF